ncbi:MAG: DUF1549 domain-containing protein, partial [Planctomycetaceae bacterium]
MRCGWLAVVLIVGIPTCGVSADKSRKVDFSREVLPILSDKCFVCHGPAGEARDALRLDSFAEATRSHDGRFAINTARPSLSEILVRIHSTDEPMPPSDARKQLTAAERTVLDRWVRQGGAYAKHWSFVRPKKVELLGRRGGEHIIDRFVGKRLRQQQIDFAEAADRRTLARRVSLVLTGLPPDPKPLAAFL